MCSPDPPKTCADEATIKSKIEELTVEVFFLNTNFDGTNIPQPLFNYLDFSFKNGLEYSREKRTTIQLNSNVGVLNDSYLG